MQNLKSLQRSTVDHVSLCVSLTVCLSVTTLSGEQTDGPSLKISQIVPGKLTPVDSNLKAMGYPYVYYLEVRSSCVFSYSLS